MRQILHFDNVIVFENSWKCDELVSLVYNHLSLKERVVLDSFLNTKRKTEWLAVRWLVYVYLDIRSEICYSNFGKPYLSDGTELSISHSGNLIALIFGKGTSVDLEFISQKLSLVAKKFLSKPDFDKIQSNHLKHYALQWSAKEVLYKMYEQGNLIFSDHLQVEVLETLNQSGEVLCKIFKPDFPKIIALNYVFHSVNSVDFVLVWTK